MSEDKIVGRDTRHPKHQELVRLNHLKKVRQMMYENKIGSALNSIPQVIDRLEVELND